MDHKTSKITESVNRALITTIFLLGQLFCSARDTIENGFRIRDNGQTLVSAGEEFEMGFFSPRMSSEKRYVGIWYKASPKTIVWVANRDDPVLRSSDTIGVFGIGEDGNLQVWGYAGGKSLWSTEVNETLLSSNLTTAKLMDSGNLILSLPGNKSLWESFENPSDTFLPGMKMVPGLALTSWRGIDDPGIGGFVFKLDDQARETQYRIMNGSVLYWRSGVKFTGSDKIPAWISDILLNLAFQKSNSTLTRNCSCTRLVITPGGTRLVIRPGGTFNGYQMEPDRENVIWLLKWSVPQEACSVSNACGSFGSCVADNDNGYDMNILVCKCLPGFEATYPDQWGSGDYSGGCKEKTRPCGDSFLNLPMMDLNKPESSGYPVSNKSECMEDCRRNCRCKAFSFTPPEEEAFKRDTSSKLGQCSIWSDPLQGLHEGYEGGRNLSVRVASSDLDSTKRNCEPCGTNIAPYPLSTGPGCGDPTYFSFHCNHVNGMLTFSSGDYQVLSINPATRRFLIKVLHLDNCGARNSGNKIFGLNRTSPFNVTNWCYGESRTGSHVSAGSSHIVEIKWDPPQEPTCGSDSDCKEWPNASCRDKKRCLCNTNYRWDDLTLNCTRIQAEESDVPLQPVTQQHSKKNTQLLLIVGPTVLCIALLACALICSIVIWRRKISKQKNSRRSDQRSKELLKLDTQKHIDHLINTGEFEKKDEEGIDVPFISFDSIIEATNGFSDSNKLGQGGYGPVYKGVFSGGQEIAVKRLSSVSGQGLEEFKNEVVLIAKLQHRNLVRLRGYCMKGDEKILLYEYMPNRSLDAFIFDDNNRMILDWEKRFRIIGGIARGLLYLHQDSRLRIIHRDLKTSNILLDQEMEPKISDFGLARIVGGKQTEANTNRVVGTYGYMSPEYALEGLFSVKSDVFSFGVVLLEIISGKRNTRLVQSEPRLSLLGYAWRVWTENNAMELIDPCLDESCKKDEFLKCVKVGLLCVQEDPSMRPAMSSIVTMLDSESDSVPNPQQPAFVLKSGDNIASSSSSTKPDETHGEITATLHIGR